MVPRERDRVSRRASATAVAAACLALVAAPAVAAPNGTLDVQGTLQGASTWQPLTQHISGCDPAAPLTGMLVQGTYSATSIGTGTYTGSIVPTAPIVCPSDQTPGGPFGPGPPFAVAGSITFSGHRGSFVATIGTDSSGVAIGEVHGNDYAFDLRLTVTSGTRRYSKATGSLTLAYSTIVDLAAGCPCTPNDAGVLTGTIMHVQAPLQHSSAPVLQAPHLLADHRHN